MTQQPRATKAYKAGVEHFDRFGYRDSPLSGEWAGESMTELSDDYGIDLFDTDVADLFEHGFEEAYGKAFAKRGWSVGEGYRTINPVVGF